MPYRHASDPGGMDSVGRVAGARKSSAIDSDSTSQASLANIQKALRRFTLSKLKNNTGVPESNTWGSYGLHLLHDPPDAIIDIIFVHGLRGGSIKTWCKNEDLKSFWPQAWLPREADLQHARIHSFGYNADWLDTKEATLDLHDFGRSLLAEMSTSPHIRRAKETPILLVGHSMGGIVIKKAYILAQLDHGDHGLADRIRCMFFLATPHRGSDSAKLLNNIIRASTVLSSRQYILDLYKGSPSLQVINDEFRTFTDKLQIWSFYETLETKLGVGSSVIVDRDSAVLGCKGEIAQPLNADHRDICKFDSPQDPNYLTLRNTLAKAVEDLLGDVIPQRAEKRKAELGDLKTFLATTNFAEDDLARIELDKTDGTCEWAVTLASFTTWRDSVNEEPLFFWLTGEPGAGKSVTATHIIRHLKGIGADVCFHFFRHGHKTQQSVTGLLMQLAYQMAIIHPLVRQSLYIMQEMAATFDKDDERAIWRKLFMNQIFKLPLPKPQYWIIDGLDECVDALKLFGLISRFDSAFPVRFYFITRKRPDFDHHFNRFGPRLYTHHLIGGESLSDIRAYICDQADMLPVDEEDGDPLIDRIVEKSKGNFLWVKLALEELKNVYTDEGVDEVLNEMPEGMAEMYARILDAMAKNTRETKLTKAILYWVICGARNFTINELEALLKLDLDTKHVRNIERSVNGLCGQLLRVDQTGTVQVIHATVRDFLLNYGDSPFAIQKEKGHQRLAMTCLQYLVSDEMSPPRNRSLVHVRPALSSAFAEYACTSFSEHVVGASAQSDKILLMLCQFFRTNVLSWIEYIARYKRDLYYITRTAQNLRSYLERRAKYTSPLCDNYRMVKQWTSDLIHIVAKFAPSILSFPSGVFYLVPALCPNNSAIFNQFAKAQSGFKLRGFGDTDWNDCISCIDYRGVGALSLAAGDEVFAIGQKTGQIILYHTETCQELTTLMHGEPVSFLKFDHSSHRLLASGNRCLNMFHVCGTLIWTSSNLDLGPVKAAAFSDNDEIIVVVTQKSSVAYLSARDGKLLPSDSLGREDCKQLKDSTRQAVFNADISPDLKMMAVIYRGRPVQLWSLESNVLIGTCWFKRDNPGSISFAFSEVLFNRNPAVGLLAVASQDGELAVFDPWTQQELRSVSGEAYTLACTSDGRTLASGDMRGTIKLWDFETLTLLYCMNSDDYEMPSLAFSGNGLRLYDIRDDQTKVWEPLALVRQSVPDGSSISESVAQPAIVVDRVQEITEILSIAAMGTKPFVLAGMEDGSVALFSTPDAKLRKTLNYHSRHLLITNVSWSAANYVATADASSVVQVWAINADDDNAIEAHTNIFKAKLSSSIRNIALSPNGALLLVCEDSSDSIYQLSKPEDGLTSQIPTPQSLGETNHLWAWIPQPVSESQIAMIADSTLYIYRVSEESGSLCLRNSATLTVGPNSDSLVASTMMFTESSKFLAVNMEPRRRGASCGLLVYCVWNLLSQTMKSPNDEHHTLTPYLYLDDQTIRFFIGWHEHTLVFLDSDLWICSIDMASVKSNGKTTCTRTRHFFIPYELIGSNKGVLPVLAGGTNIVFPREGCLTIIEDALSSAFVSEEMVLEL